MVSLYAYIDNHTAPIKFYSLLSIPSRSFKNYSLSKTKFKSDKNPTRPVKLTPPNKKTV
jgi:hypothetical protein